MLRRLVVTAACLVTMLSIAEGAEAATCQGDVPAPNHARGSGGTLLIVCDDGVSDVTAGTATPDKVTLSGKGGPSASNEWTYNFQLTDPNFEGDIDIPFTADGGTPFTAQILDVGFPECLNIGFFVRAGTTGEGVAGTQCEEPDVGDTLTASVTAQPSAGTIGAFTGGGPGDITRVLSADYQVPAGTSPGFRDFTFSVDDGHGGVVDGNGLLFVADAAPSCASRTVNLARNTSVGIPLSCSDPDAGTTLVFNDPDDDDPPLVELGTLGVFNFAGSNPITASVKFTAGSETGFDSFAYSARDYWGAGQPGIVNINVTGSGAGGPGGGPGDAADEAAGSGLSVKGKQKGSSGAVSGYFTNAVAGSSAAISVAGNSKGGSLAKAVVLGKRKLKNLKAGKVKFKVKLTKKARRQLKRALRRKKAVKVKLKIVVKPPSGSGGKATALRKGLKLVR